MSKTDSELMDRVLHEPTEDFVKQTNIWKFMQEHGFKTYDELHARSVSSFSNEPKSGLDWFWDEIVDYLDIEFYTPYEEVRDASQGPQFTDWYSGGTINIAHNVLDRHADINEESRNRVACIWEAEDGETRRITYQDLQREANQVANLLEQRDVGKGDTVGLYMPMTPEVISILYGCFKVGAIAVPIFSGFGTEATATRIRDSECTVLFTGDGFYRRGEEVLLKEAADEAIDEAGYVDHTIVVDRLGHASSREIPWNDDRDELWDEAVLSQSATYDTKEVPSDHPAMLLYSSGTTGMPKGIIQTHAGAQVQSAKELHFGFDLQPSDRFFWVSDIGWMMGPWTLIGTHTFGATMFMYEGAPDHPEPDRFWEMIDRHKITQFGISPTAIRALRKQGDHWVKKHDLSSLRLLGSTGEPWDPESWEWFYKHVGNSETPIINISGGTEIFGCFLMPMPTQELKPCTLGGPGLGMDIDIVNERGESIVDKHERGYLVARSSCPSMTNSLWSGDQRYLDEYWSTWEDIWDHGDWAQKDEDGFWFLHGRADDALNVAGRKVGPAEIEAVAMEHSGINQAAAVGVPDDVTGTAVVLYLIAEDGHKPSEDLRDEVRKMVDNEHGKPFRPREIIFVNEFPKTQSGKVVRRVIRSKHIGEDLGDLSSIENPEALEALGEAGD